MCGRTEGAQLARSWGRERESYMPRVKPPAPAVEQGEPEIDDTEGNRRHLRS